MTAENLAIWLLESSLMGFVVLGCGAFAVKVCHEPIKRISLIQWTLIAAVATPLLIWLPLATPWSLTVLPPLPAIPGQSAALPAGAETQAAVPPSYGTTRGTDKPVRYTGQLPSAALDTSGDAVAPLQHLLGFSTWQAGLSCLYGLAVCVLLMRLGMGIIARRRLFLSASAAPAAVAALLSDVGGNPSRRVRLLTSDRVKSPVTWGLLRPVILLPSPWPKDKTSAELRFVLAHEWSHIAQRDIASCYLALVAEFICFYQPMFWWLRRKLALCQDHLADARAAECADTPEEYAAFLVSLARQRPAVLVPGVLGISSRRSHLFRRVSMLCSSASIARRASFRWKATVAAVALLAIAAVTTVRIQPISAAAPPTSTVRVEEVPALTAIDERSEKPRNGEQGAANTGGIESNNGSRTASTSSRFVANEDSKGRGEESPLKDKGLNRGSESELIDEVRAAHAANFNQIETMALSCFTKMKFASEDSETAARQLVLWQPAKGRFLATDAIASGPRAVRRQPITLDLLFGRAVDAKIFSKGYPEPLMKRSSITASAENTYRISTYYVNDSGPKLFFDWYVRKENGYYPHHVVARVGETAEQLQLTEEGKFSYTKKDGKIIPKLAIIHRYDDRGKLSHSIRIFVTRYSLSAIEDAHAIEKATDLSEEVLFGAADENAPDRIAE